MSTSNSTRLLRRGAPVVTLSLLTFGVISILGARCYAQTQGQPYAGTKLAKASEGSEVPAPVAKELQAMKAQIGQLQSQLNYLAGSVRHPQPPRFGRPVLRQPKPRLQEG